MDGHEELFWRVEPYVLKYIDQFDSNQLLRILNTYLRSSMGTSDFISILLAKVGDVEFLGQASVQNIIEVVR